ncbi:uncharacterized protein C18orf19 homolog A-like [Brienomyrus brachyistius]|uniref:uncharacterized protein C18orf19 homolog A-like n=1 Tax=Brienomyrus brachyistius TaxID=42636 RepID=UPI0020B277CA|nr:uncharacterized protein C18orf19 homolog A-like [Brienomyrus brachyistius]
MHKFVRNLTRLQQVSLRPLFQGLSHSPVAPGPWTGKGSPSLCHVSTSAVARQDNAVRPQQPENSDPFQDKSIGLVQRFKKTLKQYGPVMIPVHLVTSSIWFGAFYYAAMKGVNVVPLLEHVGLPEKVVKLMEESQSGHAITALTLYKVRVPACLDGGCL